MEFGLAPTHLANFRIPTEGMLSLDFVSFRVPEGADDMKVAGFNYLLDVLRQPLTNSSKTTKQVGPHIYCSPHHRMAFN